MSEFADRIGNEKQASAHGADDIKAGFAIVFCRVDFIDSGPVIENFAGNLETDAVLAVILRRFLSSHSKSSFCIKIPDFGSFVKPLITSPYSLRPGVWLRLQSRCRLAGPFMMSMAGASGLHPGTAASPVLAFGRQGLRS